MLTFLVKTLQLLGSLAILVFVHELGHFLFAKLFKIRVEKFYLFFDWKFALLRFKPKNSHTEYGIGWLPLGGYCKIAGMVDESLDTEALQKSPEPWEFRAKPAWQRLLVMAGGVIFNIILAFAIYTGIAYNYGEEKIPMSGVENMLSYSSVGHRMGLEDGDTPFALDGKEIKYFENTLMQDIAEARILTALRGNDKVDIEVPGDLMRAIIASDSALIRLEFPAVIKEVLSKSEAEKAGLLQGDKIVGLNNQKVSINSLVEGINLHRGDSIHLTVARGNQLVDIGTFVDPENKVGIAFTPPFEILEVEHFDYGFLKSIPAGFNRMVQTLSSYTSSLKYVFTKEGASQLGGLGTIGSLFPKSFNWLHFWDLTALLSVILAVMNILPIPALDGGHIMFLLYEVITRRKPSVKVMERAQIFGLLLLLGLMLYANLNDVIKFLF